MAPKKICSKEFQVKNLSLKVIVYENFDLKNIWVQNIQDQNIQVPKYFKSKKSWVKNFESRKMLGKRKVGPRNFRSKIFLGTTNFWYKRILVNKSGPKKNLGKNNFTNFFCCSLTSRFSHIQNLRTQIHTQVNLNPPHRSIVNYCQLYI